MTVACGKSKDSEDIFNYETTAPVYKTFTWPESDIAKLLPVPKSSVGKIEWEGSYGFVIYVAETSKSDYDEYVSQCQEAGFTIDYNKGDDYFWADNIDGYNVSLRYEENDVMFVRIDEPEEVSSTSTEEITETEEIKTETFSEPSETKTADNKSNTEVTPEFKEAMDSYEAFFNEYVDFMNKYNSSDDQLSLMSELADYMSKYADMMSKLEDIKDDELSVADTIYYTEVNARIMKKLAEIEQ